MIRSTLFAAILTYLEPLVAAMVGFFSFGEPLGPTGVAGAALIIAAGAAVALTDVRQSRTLS